MSGGQNHEHISEVRWKTRETGERNTSTRQHTVEGINKGGRALVTDGARVVEVRVVDADPPYIRTWADGVWTDNLLALPRY